MGQFICIAVAVGISAITLRAQDQPKFPPGNRKYSMPTKHVWRLVKSGTTQPTPAL